MITVEAAAENWLQGAPVPSLEMMIEAWGPMYRSYRRTWDDPSVLQTRLASTMDIHAERDAFIRKFGFSCPTSEALDLLAAHAPLVEIGAGSGFWSKLLQDRGVDIIATDPKLDFETWWPEPYTDLLRLQGKTTIRRYPDRNVFCSWASLNETWLRQAFRAMRPGRVLLCVMEDAVATPETFSEIERRSTEVAEPIELIGWHFCHDRLYAWRKAR